MPNDVYLYINILRQITKICHSLLYLQDHDIFGLDAACVTAL